MNVYTYLYTYILQTVAFIMHLCLYIFSDTRVITISGFPVTTRTIIFPCFWNENGKLRLHFLLKSWAGCIQCYVYLQLVTPEADMVPFGFHGLTNGTYWGFTPSTPNQVKQTNKAIPTVSVFLYQHLQKSPPPKKTKPPGFNTRATPFHPLSIFPSYSATSVSAASPRNTSVGIVGNGGSRKVPSIDPNGIDNDL